MPVSATIRSLNSWGQRQQARLDHERLPNSEDDTVDLENGSQQGLEVAENPSSLGAAANATTSSSSLTSLSTRSNNNNNNTITSISDAVPNVETVSDDEADDAMDLEEGIVETTGTSARSATTESGQGPRTRSEMIETLEEERENVRRRSSVCLLLSIFVLFRLWIEALTQADFWLLMVCFLTTCWVARWIRASREREEQIERRITALRNGGGDGQDRNDLRMLSFQAQLTLAIMESQRQMLEGGYGHPDGAQAGEVGVSDAAKESWTRFTYKADDSQKPAASAAQVGKGDYGTVAQDDKLGSADYEEPACTVCLCEYEDGDRLVRLPCGHEFHEDCINAWTSNHTRCPLCNHELETVAGETEATSTTNV